MAQHGRNERDERRTRAKRMAWGLAALAVFFYVAYFAWMFLQSS
jgi:hypothetical protein